MEIHPEDLFTIKKQHLMLSGGKKTSQENILNMRQLGKCMFIKWQDEIKLKTTTV